MTASDTLLGRRILVLQQRGWALHSGLEIGKRLAGEGCRLAAVTFRHDVDNLVRTQGYGKYEFILSNDQIMNDPGQYLGDDDISLEEICEELGILSVWELVQSLRGHVKSYADKFYYGFKQSASDEEIVRYVKACYKAVRETFDTFSPEFILGRNFVSLLHIFFNLYAFRRQVPMIAFSDSKIRNLLYFSYSYLEDRGPFLERFQQLRAGQTSENRHRAQQYMASFRQRFISAPPQAPTPPRGLIQTVKSEILPYFFCLKYYALRGWRLQDSTGPTKKNPPPRYILRDHYLSKRYGAKAASFRYHDPQKLGRYAFFPLQFQPEESIDVHAARFNNQLETARQVAMSLPGGMTLAVKDHPDMVNLRPSSYLHKLARTPNIKLMDYRLPTEGLIKNAEMVVAPVGTVIFEASMLRKPVIQLGPLGKTLMLENVHHHTDFTTLAAAIKTILAAPIDPDKHDHMLEDYISAMFDIGFELSYRQIIHGDEVQRRALVEMYLREVNRYFEGREGRTSTV